MTVTVFQTVDQLPGRLVEENRTPRSAINRRIGLRFKAYSTRRRRQGKRDAEPVAYRCGDNIERHPASAAQVSLVLDNRLTDRALRRQHEINHRTATGIQTAPEPGDALPPGPRHILIGVQLHGQDARGCHGMRKAQTR